MEHPPSEKVSTSSLICLDVRTHYPDEYILCDLRGDFWEIMGGTWRRACPDKMARLKAALSSPSGKGKEGR